MQWTVPLCLDLGLCSAVAWFVVLWIAELDLKDCTFETCTTWSLSRRIYAPRVVILRSSKLRNSFNSSKLHCGLAGFSTTISRFNPLNSTLQQNTDVE
ncbi:hypothetical protein EVAR_33274_1 [Eumeta japonica]|uniref:Uncharacterized protein n=1 Tax=Eumeta variegata TaxID=151549 RepID=A0A4C1X118_EUMVA|nr:hypothetical protein EVAR_33274_1 [Eumeta japonica]